MINKLVLQGRLTKDPELKTTESGVPRILFTVAWSEKYKEVEKVCFMLCRAWRYRAEFVANYFHKGSEIAVVGKMVTEKWHENESTTFLEVDEVHFCGKKRNENQQEKPIEGSDGFVPVDEEIGELPFK